MIDTKTVSLDVTRGDTFELTLETPEALGDLSSVYFTCRNRLSDQIIFQKSLGDGVVKVTDGVYLIRVAPEDTANLREQTYFYDLEIGYEDDFFTPIRGNFAVWSDATRRTSV